MQVYCAYCCQVSSSLIIDLLIIDVQFDIHCALISPKTAAGTKSDTLNSEHGSGVNCQDSAILNRSPILTGFLVYSSTYRLIFSRAPRFLPKMGPGD